MKTHTARWTLTTLTVVLTIVSILYRVVRINGYSHTGLMFIGIPFVLSLLLIFSSSGKSPKTIVLKGMTLFLLMTGILLWEGIIILMAAPIFYAIAFISVTVTEKFLKNNPKVYCSSLLFILLLSTEGTHDFNSWNRLNTVTVERWIEVEEAAFKNQLAAGPQLDHETPLLFQLGFPTPTRIENTGTHFEVDFSGPEELENKLQIMATVIDDHTIEYRFPKDTTKVGQWLRWDSGLLHWEETSKGKIKLSFTIHFTRKLDPIWYFGPLQKYAVREATEYLLTTWFDERTLD
jgi:hypothetical protein